MFCDYHGGSQITKYPIFRYSKVKNIVIICLAPPLWFTEFAKYKYAECFFWYCWNIWKWVFGDNRFPPFSDTYERSRRATAGKLLAISLRFFFVFKKNRDFSKTSLNTLQKISAVSEKCFFLITHICILKLIGNSSS